MSTWNWRAILIGTAAVVGVLVVGVVGWFFVVTQNLPSEDELANYEPPIMSRVHAGDGKLVAEFATQHRVYVPSEELPDQLVQAFISAEDKTFFEHSGIDLWGMFRGTVLNALQGKKIAGGSTITQQVVKNMLVGDERSIDRKVREAVLAMRIEKKLSKEQILELYMNEIYLGGRSYGVGAAALNYFGKSLGQLSLAECAMLAGLPQAPGKVNPYNNPDAAIDRRNYVIGRMVANGYVDKAAGDKAMAEPLKVVNRLDTDENQAAAYYVEELRKEILALGDQKKLEGIDGKHPPQIIGYSAMIRPFIYQGVVYLHQYDYRRLGQEGDEPSDSDEPFTPPETVTIWKFLNTAPDKLNREAAQNDIQCEYRMDVITKQQ